MKKISLTLGALMLAALASVAVITPAHAQLDQQFQTGNEGNIYIPSDVVVDAPYFGAGANLELNGTMQDDVFVFGALITINGDVDGDVFAFGSVININGNVSGDIRGAGSQININGNVGKNVMMAGAIITISPDVQIGKNLIAAGAQILNQGSVGKNIHGAGAQVILDGPVGGSVYLAADEEGTILVRPQAQIAGNLEYTSRSMATIDEGAQIAGETVFTKYELGERPPRPEFDGRKLSSIFAGVYVAISFIGMLMLMVVALAYVGLFKNFNESAQKAVTQKVGMKFLLGIATLIVAPILLVLLFATVVGIPLALMGFAVYAIAAYLSKVVVAIWAGDTIMRAFRNAKEKGKSVNQYLAAIVGVIVVSVLLAIPVIGWILKIFVAGWGMGVLVQVSRDKLNLA